jgi:hypothetical protein
VRQIFSKFRFLFEFSQGSREYNFVQQPNLNASQVFKNCDGSVQGPNVWRALAGIITGRNLALFTMTAVTPNNNPNDENIDEKT